MRTKPLIVAIEPDRRQATQLQAIARNRLHAELVLDASAERAFAALGTRIPDLILTSALLSPTDEVILGERLRAFDGAAAHVQTLTIPMFARAGSGAGPRGGVLSALRRGKAQSAPDGCDPAVFAAQCAEYIERVRAERQMYAADDLTIEEAVVEERPIEQRASVEHAPAVDERAIEEFAAPEDAPAAVEEQIVYAEPVHDEQPIQHEPAVEYETPVQYEASAEEEQPVADIEEPRVVEETVVYAQPGVVFDPALEAVRDEVFSSLNSLAAGEWSVPPRVRAPEPVVRRAAEVAPTPIVERTPESAREPIARRALERTPEPIVEGATESIPEPVVERAAESMPEPSVDRAVAHASNASMDVDLSTFLSDPIVIAAVSSKDAAPATPKSAPVTPKREDPPLYEIAIPAQLAEPPTRTKRDHAVPLRLGATHLWPDIEGVVVEPQTTPPAASRRPSATPIDRAPRAERSNHQPAETLAPTAAANGPTAPAPAGKRRKRRPVQDEWGFFDPEQAGFAALLAKLDEISDDEPAPPRPLRRAAGAPKK